MIARTSFIVLIALWPLLGFSPVPVPLLLLGAVLAYDGVQPWIWAWTILLMSVEMVYSVDLGMDSLAFVLTAALFAGAGHWLNLRPASQDKGWSVGGLVRASVIAIAAAALMGCFAVAISSLVYGHGDFAARLGLEFGGGRWLVWWLVVAALALIALKRNDEPFRKKITFGI